MGLNASDLRHYASLQDRVTGSPQQFASGEYDQTWAEVAKVWCDIRPLIGREFFAADAVNAEVNVKIRMRWRTGLHAGMRLVHQGKIYDLTQPADVGSDNIEVVWYCRQGASEG